jgi:ADP-ribose pyrophosphatase
MIWKQLDTEYLFKDQWLTVRKDTVELPGGPVIPSFYVLEYPDWINVIGVTKNEELILVKQYRHGLGKVSYELCAGICDAEDVSPLETAKREMLEETGYGGGNWQEWMVVSANPGTHTNLTYCFLATDLEIKGKQMLEETEQLSVHLFSPEEVKEMLLRNEIWQSLHAAPLWKYFALPEQVGQ